ncbi:MAG TPA: hypothetical protein VHA33_17180 [Candidatus Angelobacter sp.]|nr:hypothetical protein [Candidatus Angelobacter sp.]
MSLSLRGMKTLRYPPGKPGFTAKDAKGAKEGRIRIAPLLPETTE